MASFPKEHTNLYFDALIRTQKKESVLAFIMATYYAKKNSNDEIVKEDLYKRLEYAYGLFRDNIRGYDNGVGSYVGIENQFSSQYTLGLEMGIWKNSKFDLNDLALKVATNKITITDYFDIVMLNYIQPINGKIVHPVYQILCYIKNNNLESIKKSNFSDALGLPTGDNAEAINALYNILIGTSYFEDNNNALTVSKNYNIDILLSKCNKKYLGENGYEKAKEELKNSDEKYVEYLTSQYEEVPSDEEIKSEIESEEKIEDRKLMFKKWLTDSGRFKPNSVRNYSYYINYIKKHGYTEYDLYTINNTSIIDDLLKKFNNDEKYIYWNKENRYTPSNALSAYKEFLMDDKFNSEKNFYITSIKNYSTDHKPYFDKYGYMYWYEGQSKKYKVGDVIYLYFSDDNGQEITSVRKKGIISEVNVSLQRIINEKYNIENGIYNPNKEGYYFKVEIIGETDSTDLQFKKLKEKFGLIAPQTGVSFIGNNKELIDYLERYFSPNEVKSAKELIIIDDINRVTGAYNKIYYGVPGSGKSHKVDEDFNKKSYVIERTTFHPEYTNSDFVGQIIPMVKDDNTVEYKFHPGAFTIQLEYALKHKDKKVCLIIEEINRGNASAIFGDIFQLLDRYKSGKGKYEIYNGQILDYLKTKGIKLDKIYIPSNMWIVATMNTSDQNVFTLDTAFKRRWKMEYIRNVFADNDESIELRTKVIRQNSKYPNVTWEKFVNKINKHIISDKSGINGEDKQLGMYFVTVEEVNNSKEFAEKILSYLWEDVAKINTTYWFGSISSYDELIESYEKFYLDVFNNLFEDEIRIDEETIIKTIGE